ncbi:hypothetical protein N431DRAFT_476026 [Stipitochalara longipes BDJ]|nr:hypothetical protein N431DRAFT_476026 [Stipitochalara longipes BDJ]
MLAIVLCLVILCNSVALAHAYTTFQTNCTAPSTSVNFVSSNETRGTIDILWSCLFTIIACTWTVQHLNVPEQREDRDKGWLGDIKWALKRTFRSAGWMLVTVFAPEALIIKSLADRFAINAGYERLSLLAAEDEVPWSRTHSLFANMGGFVIRCNVPERVGKLKDVRADPASSTQAVSPDAISNGQEPDVTLQSTSSGHPKSQALFKAIGSIDVETQLTTPSSEYSNPYHLLASNLVALKEAGLLTRLPFITTDELNDKSKSDNLVRFLAVIQIFWMVIQIILRASRHLAVSQLEIAVVAFAICAVMIYVLNWEKPKGVQTPYTILQYHGAIPQAVLENVGEVRQKELLEGSLLTAFYDFIIIVGTWGLQDLYLFPGSAIPDYVAPIPGKYSKQTGRVQFVGLLLGGMMFGAVHVAAWDFEFPSLAERNLWRVASIVCTAVPFFTFLIAILPWVEDEGKHEILDEIRQIFLRCFLILMWVMYFASRLFLLIEIFRTLFFLPPSAYVATWAANVPHVA